jgi:hypothetical protein
MKLMNIADERDDSGDSGDGKNDPAALVEADVGMAIDVAGNRIKQLIYIYIYIYIYSSHQKQLNWKM